jgi:phosphoglycerate dehydrogenase-like enzyme
MGIEVLGGPEKLGELLTMDNLVRTPHVAGATYETSRR